MHFLSESDAHGRLICTIPSNRQSIRVTSQDASQAAIAKSSGDGEKNRTA